MLAAVPAGESINIAGSVERGILVTFENETNSSILSISRKLLGTYVLTPCIRVGLFSQLVVVKRH